LGGYRLALVFEDGTEGVVDLAHLAGQGVFAAWKDRAVFEAVRTGAMGELVWGDSLDLCPDALYLRVTGKPVKEVFPRLKHEPAHA
jgi:hypothetical protein